MCIPCPAVSFGADVRNPSTLLCAGAQPSDRAYRKPLILAQCENLHSKEPSNLPRHARNVLLNIIVGVTTKKHRESVGTIAIGIGEVLDEDIQG